VGYISFAHILTAASNILEQPHKKLFVLEGCAMKSRW